MNPEQTEDNLPATSKPTGGRPLLEDTIPIGKLIELRNKGLSYNEIARIVGCSKTNTFERLAEYSNDIDNLKSFKENKADILAVQQSRLLNNLTMEDIKKSSGYQKVGMFSVLHNQERLERGESTANVSMNVLSGKIDEVASKRKALALELGIDES